jgi:hypothetical protein
MDPLTFRKAARPRRRIARLSFLTTNLLICTAFVQGCAGDRPDTAGWQGTVDTLAGGGIRVVNPERPLWNPGEEWRVTEELRIGGLAAEGPDLFGDVVALELDDDGRIWILEREAREVRVFGPDGEHIRSFGRRGGGPGEFADPVGMGWAPGGELWVVDPGNGRFSVFDPEGRFLRSHPRLIGGYMLPWPGGFGPGGEVFDRVFIPGGAPGSGALVRFSPDLTAADTFPLPPPPDRHIFELVTNGGRMSVPVPFSPALATALDRRGYLWFGVSDESRLIRRTLGGDTILITEWPSEREPVTARDREEALEQLAWFTGQGGTVDARRIPAEKPFFTQIFLGDDGHLWVTPGDGIARGWERFDILDPDGRYLGEVRPDPPIFGWPTPVIRDDVILAVVRDEMEVPYVVRYRIER